LDQDEGFGHGLFIDAPYRDNDGQVDAVHRLGIGNYFIFPHGQFIDVGIDRDGSIRSNRDALVIAIDQ
jgi:hypothetical protein